MSRYDHLIARLRAAAGYDLALFREAIMALPLSEMMKLEAMSVIREVDCRWTAIALQDLDNCAVICAEEVFNITREPGVITKYVEDSATPAWSRGQRGLAFIGREAEERRAAAATVTAAVLILIFETLKGTVLG